MDGLLVRRSVRLSYALVVVRCRPVSNGVVPRSSCDDPTSLQLFDISIRRTCIFSTLGTPDYAGIASSQRTAS